MSPIWLSGTLLMGCWGWWGGDTAVITKQARRASEVDVQSHVTGGQPAAAVSAPTDAEAEQALQLAALGYIDSGDAVDAARQVGTLTLDDSRSVGGINVYTLGGQAGAVAVDMAGVEVHRWDFSIPDAWPGFSHPEVQPETIPWRRAQVLPGGDLIGVWSGYGIVRITADSELVWGHWLTVHHDLHVYPDERVLTITTEFSLRPDLYLGMIAEDQLTWMSADGYPVRSVSLLKAFEKYPQWDQIWEGRPVRNNEDIFHTNTVHVLEKDYTNVHPAFKAGRVLTSMRHLDAIALVDPDTEAVVWARQGVFRRQHDPQMAADGMIWIFDNQGGGAGHSRMIKMDPESGDILDVWRGSQQHPFFTKTCGHAQQLSSGNLLVVSSEQGVVFELAADKSVVWKYAVPETIQGSDGQLRVARFFEFQRLEPQQDLRWLRGAAAP